MTFQDKLKEIYKRQDKIAQLIEGLDEIPQQTMQDYYVKLQTIIKEDEERKSSVYESILGEKKEIEIEQIFHRLEESADAKDPAKLLILGAAGVGKSTLMQYMAHKWSIGEIWSGKFDYVYRVNLKTLLNNEWKEDYEKSDLRDSKLKCLAHYHLIKDLTRKERIELKLENLTWSTDRIKILLLLDGYDEVAHLRSTSDYKDLFEEIFEHQNLIITSRPNAVDKEMQKNFDRTIENTGLDNKGIEQYFIKYFRKDTEEGGKKGEELQTFLDGNAAIKGICHIPVNIAMLCYIWSESDSSVVLQEISNMSDLYSQVVQQLGFRYFAKWKYDGPKIAKKELKDIWKGGAVNLDELQILQHTAYKSTTGGGIEVDDNERVETLIIKGMQSKGDKDGISIQSSINYLRAFRKTDQITIVEVYRYGLLKSEAVKLEELNSPTQQPQTSSTQKQVVSDTELLKQNYEFIHLTFQEYLTSNYFKEMLEHGDDQQKKEICQFIAEHRNEPRYLMMLKFMAGIVTADRSNDGDKIAQMFWEVVTCNVDGVIELGVETKVNLLMHLLSQARIQGEIDSRIANRESILQLIDVVVLKDLVAWGEQLKDSDYISDNIKQGLLEGLRIGSVKFNNRKIQEIQDKATPELKTAIGIITQAKTETTNADKNIIISSYIEIVSNIINKFNLAELTEVINTLQEIITETPATEEKKGWQLIKHAIDGITKIAMQVKLLTLTKVGNIKVESIEELIKVLVSKIKEANYEQAAVRSIVGLLHSMKDETLTTKTIEQFSEFFVDSDSNVKKAATRSLSELVKSIEEKGLVAELIEKFSKLLVDKDWAVRTEATSSISELMKSIKSKELVRKFIDQFSELFTNQNSSVKITVAEGTIELVKIIKEKGLVEGLIDKFITLLRDQDNYVRKEAAFNTSGLVKCIEDQELVKKLIDNLSTLLVDKDSSVRHKVAWSTGELVKCIEDQELVKKLIDNLSTLLADPDPLVRNMAVWKTNELVKYIDQELVRKLIDTLSILLKNLDSAVRRDAVWSTSELVKCIEDQELVESLIDKFGKLFEDKDSSVRATAAWGTSELVKAIKDKDSKLVKEFIEKFSKLLEDENNEVRRAAAQRTSELVNNIEDKGLAENLIAKFSKLLKDEDSSVRVMAAGGTVELVKSIEDKGLAAELIEKFSKLLEDENNEVRRAAIWNISELVEHIIEDTELVRTLINILNRFLTDSNNAGGYFTTQEISELVKSIQNTELVRKFIDKFSTFLADPSNAERYLIAQETSELVQDIKNKYNELVEKLIDKLSVLLESPGDNMPLVLGGLEIMIKNLLLPLEKFKEYLNHQNKEIRNLTILSLVEPFKEFLTKCTLLEELLKGEQNLTIKIIEEQLFDNNLNQNLRVQILESLHKLASSGDKDTKDKNLTDLKGKILFELNKIGNVKSHELIEIALLVLGQEDTSAEDFKKKELVELAKKVINYQIEHLSDEGLKWINDNFKDLVSLSKESQAFIKTLYHKILGDLETLQDLEVIKLKKELIIKFINQGLTTSLTKKGEVIFEGKKCAITGDNKELILEEIARAVIDQKQDMLAVQYREHTPLFKNTGSSLDVAAADISAESIIDDRLRLQHNAWNLSLMHFSDHKKSFPTKVFLLLEGRNAFGNLVIYKIPSDGPNKLDYFVKYPSYVDVNTEFCESIFEKMEYTDLIKPRYYVSSFDVSYDQSQTLLDKINSHLKPKDSSDMVAVRKSLIELLEEIIDSGIYKVISTVAWDEYKDLKTINKVQVLHIKDEGKVALIKQESFRIDDAEKTAQKLKVHGKAIVDIKTTLNLLESVTNTMQKQVDESAMTKKDRDGMEEAIKSLDQSVKNIASKVSDQDPIMQQITAELTELSQRKEVDTTTFLNLRKKIKTIEDQLKEGAVTVQMLDKVVYDNPLLNNLELMKDAAKLLGMNFNELLNLSKGLSQGLITEAIENNDPAIILGGLISLAGTNEYIEIYSYY